MPGFVTLAATVDPANCRQLTYGYLRLLGPLSPRMNKIGVGQNFTGVT